MKQNSGIFSEEISTKPDMGRVQKIAQKIWYLTIEGPKPNPDLNFKNNLKL